MIFVFVKEYRERKFWMELGVDGDNCAFYGKLTNSNTNKIYFDSIIYLDIPIQYNCTHARTHTCTSTRTDTLGDECFISYCVTM